MPDITLWSGDRALDTAARIAERPTSIVIIRAGAKLAAQTVRIEPLSMPGERRERRGENAIVVNTAALVTGYKGHDTIADTNIRRGDRFLADGRMMTVTAVLVGVPDRTLAIAEVSD